MTVSLELQQAAADENLPDQRQIADWIEATLAAAGGGEGRDFEVTVRIVEEAESRELNRRYRGKNEPTNVLSFPFEAPQGMPDDDVTLLGDLVICAPIVRCEARDQGKTAFEHWAHMVVHGTLHLLGYDHQTEEDARPMEALEVRLLDLFGIADPYIEIEQTR